VTSFIKAHVYYFYTGYHQHHIKKYLHSCISDGPQFVGNIAFLIETKPSEEDNKTINSPANRKTMQEQVTLNNYTV
jgi:hypothetical protein